MPPTQKEVADRLGVSQVTVSRALRGEEGVGEQQRERVMQAAREMGYQIQASNYHAQALRSQGMGERLATNVICVVGQQGHGHVGGAFNTRIFRGISDAASDRDMETILAGHYQPDWPLVVQRGQVDGVICLLGDIDIEKQPGSPGVPCVSLFYDLPGADLVTADNAGGMREVARHLCELGHRRIAYMSPDTTVSRERLRGLREVAQERGAEVPEDLVFVRRFAVNAGIIRELIDENIPEKGPDNDELPFTALAAYDDFMAVVAIQRLREKGWEVPDDLSVTGFDGVDFEGVGGPKLTTSAIPLEEIGEEGVRLLESRISRPDAPRRSLQLQTEFMRGQTTSAVE